MSWRRIQLIACCLGLLLTGPGVAQTLFTEVTEEALPATPAATRQATGDIDNDGWPDLWAIGFDDANRLYLVLNQGNGRFVQQSSIFADDTVGGGARAGGIFGDYDNDGDLDLFIPVGAWLEGYGGPDVLLRNERGILREVTPGTGLEVERVNTDNAIWLDYDRDGFLDLYLGHFMIKAELKGDPSLRNRLYRSNGDGTFTDVTRQVGLEVQLSETHGGSGQGMVAGDFNDDGWPDLYIPVYRGDNRLFLNNGQGGFADATTREIADVGGEAFGVAVGDIDNDGDLEIFQPSGAGTTNLQRSLLLLNLGKGQFLDVTEGVGLGGLGDETGQTRGAALADLDNDGDLDLVTTLPPALFLNDGNGLFSAATIPLIATGSGNGALTLGDLDLDGFLDIWLDGGEGHLLHNKGNNNHYLRVELVGVKSNRSGIGARAIATSGDLRQMREIFGGMGLCQDEMVAHFGLGPRTQVDRLEVRWPSGQVDVLTDLPADQKIRVIEGRGTYFPMVPTRWVAGPPETLVVNAPAKVTLALRPALFEPGAAITGVTADLSAFGGPAAVPLEAGEDGLWQVEGVPLAIAGYNGYRTLSVMIDQQTSLGPYWTRLSRQVTVVPGGDLMVFDEALAQDWQVEGNSRIKRLDLSEAGVVQRGSLAGAIAGDGGLWTVTFRPPAPIDPVGYIALRFAFHPGEVVPPSTARFTVTLNPGKTLSLLDSARVDLNQQEWQVVEIPVDAFERVVGPIESIVFTGTFAGTFYLDDLRLVAATPPPVTVVEEERTTALPQDFSLSQNSPNPFNSQTLIRFALPESEEIELAVYNLAGQQVAALVQGVREAGSYTIRWDGRDERGKELASGIYLYRLRAGAQVQTRKLVLVR